jgi:hypothetical protein
MLLFTLCLNTLIRMIDDNIPGVQTGNHSKRAAVIAYADNVTVILRSPAEVPIVQEALRCYGAASVAKLNIKKSAAMALGPWDTTQNVMGMAKKTSNQRPNVGRQWQAKYVLRRVKHTAET